MSNCELFRVAPDWVEPATLRIIQPTLLSYSTLWRWLLPSHAEPKLITRRYVVAIKTLSLRDGLGGRVGIVAHYVLIVEFERTVISEYALVQFGIRCMFK